MKRIKTMVMLAAVAVLMLLSTGCADFDRIEAENAQLKKENAQIGRRCRALLREISELREQSSSVTTDKSDMEKELAALRNKLSQTPGVDLLNTPEGIVIRLTDKVKFGLGKSDISPEASVALKKVGQLMQDDFAGHYFRVVGHTDKVKIKPSRRKDIPNNLYLSCNRACAVVTYLISNQFVSPGRIMAAGHGYYSPAVPWDGKTNVAGNRRVEILVLPKMKASGTPKPRKDSGPLPFTPK